MRSSSFSLLVVLSALVGMAAGSSGAAGKEPTCSERTSQRNVLIRQSQSLTSQVEGKNLELGETSDALGATHAPARKKELSRRAEGLRRELSGLLDRELDSVNRLGALDAEISKRCRKSGK